MRRSRPRFPHWRSHRPHYASQYRPQPPQQQPAQMGAAFDFLNLPDSLVSTNQIVEDPILTPIIMERNQQLTPVPADSFTLLKFVTRIRQKLDALVLAPNSFAACQVGEVRDVGSHKHDTLIASSTGSRAVLASDLVVVLKTLPTREAIDQLGQRLKQDCDNELGSSNEGASLQVQPTNYGLLLEYDSMLVHLLLTTVPIHWRTLDPSLHLDQTMCIRNYNAIKHAKWVDEACSHPSNKVLVRLLKDLRQRFSGLEPLNPWLINLLAHHCVTNHHSNEQLPPSYAFKRALQLLSSGLFLPGSNGLSDPVGDGSMNSNRSQINMTLEEQDRLCYTSQTLLRALAIHPEYVLGMAQGPDIFAGPCQLNGILFTPSEPIVLNSELDVASRSDAQQQAILVEVNG